MKCLGMGPSLGGLKGKAHSFHHSAQGQPPIAQDCGKGTGNRKGKAEIFEEHLASSPNGHFSQMRVSDQIVATA